MKRLTDEEIFLLSAKSDVSDTVENTIRRILVDCEKNQLDLDWYVEEFRRQLSKRLDEMKN